MKILYNKLITHINNTQYLGVNILKNSVIYENHILNNNTCKQYDYRGRCDCCGTNTDVIIANSSLGAISYAYCEKCLKNGYEPYISIVCFLDYCMPFNQLESNTKEYILKCIKFHNISEEQLLKDVDNLLKSTEDKL